MERYSGKKLIIASNREPYRVRDGRVEKTVGGLVSALDPVVRASNGVWVASGSADAPAQRIQAPAGSYRVRRVPLSAADIEGYYNGYSNRLLWPLCHITLDRVVYRAKDWESYRRVNGLFARTIAEEADVPSFIWLQDYHLALSAREIKRLCPAPVTSLFWHIPWPPHAVFRVCPQRKELLEGMLGNDLLGFQLEFFKFYFMGCVDAELDASVDFKRGLIRYRGHTTALRAFPISIDYAWFQSAASSEYAERFMKEFRQSRGLEGRRLGLSVNRTDYTKGLIKCLDILELFFERYEGYRGEVTFVQVCVPTRKIEPYLSYRESVKRRIDAINSRFGKGAWRPIEYIDGELTQRELAALYRHSELLLISSVYDGMNLVAKEYIASQVDLKGTALVSEFAGAASDIPGVTAINPYDIEGSAGAVKDALEADPGRKRACLELARAHIRKNDIFKWVEDILDELKTIEEGSRPSFAPSPGDRVLRDRLP